MHKLYFRAAACLSLVGASLLLGVRPVQAYPQWSIKYNVACTTCHALSFPKLNATGYNFRRLGFRLPADVAAGKPGPTEPGKRGVEPTVYNLSEYFSLEAHGSYVVQDPPNRAASGGAVTDSTNGFQFNGATIFTAGPIPDGFSFLIEDSLGNGANSGPGLGQGYALWDSGTLDNLITVKAGKFNKLEPIGPFDRSILPAGSITTSQSINGFAVGGQERGVQAGYTYKQNTSAMIGVANGVDDALTGKDTNNAKDLTLQGYHIFDKSGSSVGVFYENGYTTIGTTAATEYNDSLWTAGVGGSYFLAQNINVQAAVLSGSHNSSTTKSFNNGGYFGEFDYGFNLKTVGVVRLDDAHQDGPAGPAGRRDDHQLAIGVVHSFSPFTKGSLQFQNHWGFVGTSSRTATADFILIF